MGLHIHHGPHLLPLTEALAALLTDPLPDPFTAEVIAVPTAGVRDWLQQQLALRLGATQPGLGDGVAANIAMLFPGQFVSAALGRDPRAISPWQIERLTWSVLRALQHTTADVPSNGSSYAIARRIADLFDRYAVNRPQLLQQWRAGLDGDGTEDEHGAVVPLAAEQQWQAQLWREVREQIGEPSIAEELPHLLDRLSAGAFEPALPQRVAVFGVSGVSAPQLAVYQSLAAVRDVHLFIAHPSPAAWDSCPHRLGGRLVLRTACDAIAATRHPLLRSWARTAMEAPALLRGAAAAMHPAAPSLPGDTGTSLLHRLQRGIVADLGPDALAGAAELAGLTDPSVDTDDQSVQIHTCHGATRQLEVLRDALGHLFAADPTLAPHDVIIVCPDLQRFAPLLPAVFQRSSLPIAVRVSDLSLGAANPVAATLSALLATLAGRCTAAEILALVALDPVRGTFAFSDDDIELIDGWIAALGTTWGLDATQRAEWIPGAITEGTWSSSLDRLFVGSAMPAPIPRVAVDGIVPFDDIDTESLRCAGKLAELLARLGAARQATREPHTIRVWIDLINEMIASFVTVDRNDIWQLNELLQAVNSIRDHAGGHNDADLRGDDVALGLADVRAVLGDVFAEQHGRLNLRSGSVTATAMVPVRNIPARVVCIAGLDETSLRPGAADGDDVLTLRPCIGERDPRAEGRHLLLDALMAAGEHFIVTCDGSDITTNRPLPLPVSVSELLETAKVIAPATSVLTAHSRQAFDEANFTSDHPFSFDTAMLAAAAARRHVRAGHAAFDLLDPQMPAVVTLTDLAESCARPARTYLHGRLDARLPADADEIETNIPLTLASLEMYRLGNELLEQHRAGSDDDAIARWRLAQQSTGALPPRALADAALAEVHDEVNAVLGALGNRNRLGASGSIECDVVVPLGIRFGTSCPSIRLDEHIEHIDGHELIRVQFTRPRQRSRIRVGLELAMLVAAHPDHRWTALSVQRPESGSSKPSAERLVPIDTPNRVASAHLLLGTAVAIHLRAMREPLPMFEKSTRTLFDSASIDDDDFERDLRDPPSQFLWGHYTVDDLMAIPIRPTDEVPLVAEIAAANGCGRAHALAICFWQTFHEFVTIGNGG